MKNENEFNAYLQKEFKKHSEYKAVKVSDRFKIGLPDWLIFHTGCAAAVECKYAKTWRLNQNMLGHPVSRPQITALKSFHNVNIPSAILIGVDDAKTMYLGPYEVVTKTGNVTGEIMQQGGFQVFKMSEVHDLLKYLFYSFPSYQKDKPK